MNRRLALKQLALISGGLILVPSCDFSQEDILQAYDNLQITPSQKTLLAQIAGTIIPAGETKGAEDIAVEDFILVMVNDCYSEEQRVFFTKGLTDMDAYSKKQQGKKFEKLSQTERETLIQTGLEDENEANKAISTFLNMCKRLTVQGFMASEYIQTQIKPYSLIPGEYQGAVLITDLKPQKING